MRHYFAELAQGIAAPLEGAKVAAQIAFDAADWRWVTGASLRKELRRKWVEGNQAGPRRTGRFGGPGHPCKRQGGTRLRGRDEVPDGQSEGRRQPTGEGEDLPTVE